MIKNLYRKMKLKRLINIDRIISHDEAVFIAENNHLLSDKIYNCMKDKSILSQTNLNEIFSNLNGDNLSSFIEFKDMNEYFNKYISCNYHATHFWGFWGVQDTNLFKLLNQHFCQNLGDGFPLLDLDSLMNMMLNGLKHMPRSISYEKEEHAYIIQLINLLNNISKFDKAIRFNNINCSISGADNIMDYLGFICSEYKVSRTPGLQELLNVGYLFSISELYTTYADIIPEHIQRKYQLAYSLSPNDFFDIMLDMKDGDNLEIQEMEIK